MVGSFIAGEMAGSGTTGSREDWGVSTGARGVTFHVGMYCQ